MDLQWNIQLFGGLRAVKDDSEVIRFPLRKVAALFAYLACYPGREHPREVLIELLWPESDLEAGRNRFSVTLSALRRILEPDTAAAGSVLQTDRFTVRLQPASVVTDIGEFQNHLRRAEAVASRPDPAEELQHLRTALDLYVGPLLPGYYDEWVLTERGRQGEAYLRALERATLLMEQSGGVAEALEYARRAVRLDPSREEAHRCLIRAYATNGQVPQALRQFQDLERILRQELDSTPSRGSYELVESIRRGMLPKGTRGAAPAVAGASVAGTPARTPAAPPAVGVTEPKAELPPEPKAVGAEAMPAVSEAEPAQPLAPPPVVGPIGAVPTAGRVAERADAAERGGEQSGLNRLPHPLTRFFGRVAEQQRLLSLLGGGERLITLTGPAGAGKTRLALELGRELGGRLSCRVIWAPLSELRDPGMIPDRVLSAVGLSRAPDRHPVEQVAAVLDGQPAVLILDNFEHLVEEGTGLVQDLLECVPSLQCLVTSRQRLNLAGEREVPIRPLQLPEGATPEEILASDSVQLFLDRARAVNPDFEVTAENAAAIREVCARLEGIPLAIELAASRAHVLTPEETVEQLGRRFDFLVSRHRHAESRHRTLAAAVEWSFRLLAPDLQRFFARLSVFQGGWTAEAAQAVCTDGLPGTALEYLALLRECSLVVSHQDMTPTEDPGDRSRPRRTRFGMLEMLREFAATRLETAERTEAHRRHREWFMQLVLDAMPKSHTPEIGSVLERLDREAGNFWSALDWSRLPEAEPQEGMRFCGVMGWFWSIRGFSPLTRDYVVEVLRRSDAAPSLHRARALFTASFLDRSVGNPEGAWRWVEEALRICREIDDEGGVAMCTATMARLSFERGDYSRCRELHQETLDLKAKSGDHMGAAMSMVGLGRLALLVGDFATAREWFERSRTFSEKIDDQICVSSALNQLSQVSRREGKLDEARQLANRALELQRSTGFKQGIAASLQALARCALAEGRHEEARGYLSGALTIRQEFGLDASLAELIQAISLLGVVSGQARQAAPLVAYACGQHDAGNSALVLLDRTETERAAGLAEEALGTREWEQLRETARRWRVDEAVRRAAQFLAVLESGSGRLQSNPPAAEASASSGSRTGIG